VVSRVNNLAGRSGREIQNSLAQATRNSRDNLKIVKKKGKGATSPPLTDYSITAKSPKVRPPIGISRGNSKVSEKKNMKTLGNRKIRARPKKG